MSYGVILSYGSFLSFMLTGSIPTIRSCVILGGALLAFLPLGLVLYHMVWCSIDSSS